MTQSTGAKDTSLSNCDKRTELSATYQVTARLLAAEQQGIWSRVQGFFAFNSFAAAVISSKLLDTNRGVQVSMAIVGVVLSFLVKSTFERSWTYRNIFIAVGRELEKELGVAHVGPLTKGKEASDTEQGTTIGTAEKKEIFKLRGLPQRGLSSTVCWIFIVIYGALIIWKAAEALHLYVFCKA